MSKHTIALEGRDNVQRLVVLGVSRLYGSPINHDGRPVQSPHSDHYPWHVFVAPRKGDVAIIPATSEWRILVK